MREHEDSSGSSGRPREPRCPKSWNSWFLYFTKFPAETSDCIGTTACPNMAVHVPATPALVSDYEGLWAHPPPPPSLGHVNKERETLPAVSPSSQRTTQHTPDWPARVTCPGLVQRFQILALESRASGQQYPHQWKKNLGEGPEHPGAILCFPLE